MVYLLAAIEAICSHHPQSNIASRAFNISKAFPSNFSFPSLAIKAYFTAYFISALSSGDATELTANAIAPASFLSFISRSF